MANPSGYSKVITKECPSCHVTKPMTTGFYRTKHVDDCIACIAQRATEKLEAKADQRMKDKAIQAQLKIEAQKIRAKKEKVKRNRAVKKLVPIVEEQTGTVQTDAATIELARRTLARRHLIEFIKQFHPKYKAGWVHYDICARLEQFAKDVTEGRSPRLMLLMPPRHGKSQIVSRLFPAWYLGHHVDQEFIGCSYNMPLALDFSREIRDVLRSDYYHKLFPQTELNVDFQSAEAWRLRSATGVGAGGYNAAGVGGGITGKGAHVLVIDDPIKNQEEADSPDIRQKIWDWYISSAYTRLAPGGGVLLIQTCWHDDDLAGRLQKAMLEDPEADQFEVIKYPAIAEEDEQYRLKGEPLHPARYDLKALERIKRTLGYRTWGALYQQNPVTEEGAYFTKGMQVYRGETAELHTMDIYQAWDLAISDKQQKANNWTVGVTIGLDYDDMMHVLEVRRMKTNDAAEIEDAILDMYSSYPNISGWGVEDGQIWKTMQSSIKRRMIEKRIYMTLSEENFLKPVTDKMVRARPLQARMQNRKVTFPRGHEWVDVLWKEFLRFPGGAQDDQVDALAWCARIMLGKSPPTKPVIQYYKREKTVAEKLRAISGGAGGHMSA